MKLRYRALENDNMAVFELDETAYKNKWIITLPECECTDYLGINRLPGGDLVSIDKFQQIRIIFQGRLHIQKISFLVQLFQRRASSCNEEACEEGWF